MLKNIIVALLSLLFVCAASGYPTISRSGVYADLGVYTEDTINAMFMNSVVTTPDGTSIYPSPGRKLYRNPVEYLKKRVPNNRTLPKSAFGIE